MNRENVEAIYRLSPVQQGMLFHTLYSPGEGVYFEQFNTRFGAGFDPTLFERLWRDLVAKNPVLRTSFAWEGLQESVQIIHRQVELPFEHLDWRSMPEDMPEEEKEAKLRAFLAEERRKGFDLFRPPLMRFSAIRLKDDLWHVAWSYHHLILDGWSTGLLLQEVTALYEAAVLGRPAPKVQPRRPFRDYVAWLRQQDLAQSEAYWRRVLGGFTTPTPLGAGRPAAPGAREDLGRGMKIALVPEEESEALKAWARTNRLTLSTVVQGAWALVLSRYSGEDDLVFGLTVSGRPPALKGVETMLGCFINTLPVRVRTPGVERVLPWLQALQADQAELRRHEHSPLVEVLGWSDVPRPTPLFESIFVFEGFMDTVREGVYQRTNYPLTLVVGPDREMVLRIDYENARFEPAAIERLLGHLRCALSAFLADPGQRLEDIGVLTPEERRQLLTVWNRPAGASREPLCLHRIFEAQAERSPGAPAVAFEDESLTYRELNERANRLAHHLRRLGVGPESRVGLCVDRSFEMVEGILGILKAGGAYVPLDPRYPSSRLAFIAEDSGLDVLVTAEALRGLVPGPAAVVCLDTADLAGESSGKLESGAGPENLAYVIYTSGSTGKPKGSLLTHGNVARLFTETDGWFHLGPEDVWSLFHSFAFDFSVWEIWGALLYGGRLVVVPYWVSRSPEAFRELLVREQVTVLNQTPSAFRQLVQADLEAAAGSLALRWVVFGGEALELASLAPWFAQHGDRSPVLVNMYGITETTVHVTYREVTQGDLAEAGRSPIGVPIPDLRVHLLDHRLNLVPVGVPGEMLVAGGGLARGYLGRPDLTAERFIPDLFGAPGERLYRSGDLARRLPSGELEYLGRIDHQVKIRGFRIELGEIEAALVSHPAVREAVVLPREEASGDRRLVGYVVPRTDFDEKELRSFLKERLPDYMVPAALMAIPAIPLTAHGKVDRRALPDPAAAAPVEKGFDPPRTPMEELLAGIWSEVLGVERVGRSDSFFDLGGHSLLATRVLSRLREVLEADLPLRMLFEAPTLADLAPRIEAVRSRSADEAGLPPLVPQPRQGDLPLSFSQERLWFLDQLQPGTAVYNIPGAVRMSGALDAAALHRSLQEVARRHETLRTVFAFRAGRPVQVVLEGLRPALPVVDLSGLPPAVCGEEVRRLSAAEASRPFDLAAGPLMRSTLLRAGEGEHVMLLTFHHIVSDAWSMDVFLRELVALYQASPLPELPVQYADFALWQRRWLDGAALEAQTAYWRERLAGVPVLQLPGDRPRPAVQSFRGAMHSFALPEPLSAALRSVARARGATVFMTVLAALQALLSRYSGQEDFAVGSPVAGRDQKAVEDLIGFFVNTLVLRTSLAGGPDFAQLLDRVRATALGAYAHQAVPFERVVQELAPERNLSYTPLFQAMLAFQNVPRERTELPGLTLSSLADEFPVSKFDLTLTAFDSGAQVFGQWVYSTALFEAATVARWAGHFQVLLEGLAADPSRRISELPLLSAAEREQLLVEWNRPPLDYPDEGFVHRLFEEQVAKTPGAVAVVFEGETLSYRELNARANRLARHLRRLGAGPEVLIGISAERSFEMVVGLLAILKAGSAYVPLDPSLPAERLSYMIEDAGIELLLTQDLPGDLPGDLLGDEGEIAEDLGVPLCPENPAYVIYTSGSTGLPKGVAVSHRALGNRLQYARTGDVRAEDAFLQKTTISFDVSLLEIFAPLVIGGRTVLARPGGQQDPEYLLRLIREQRVTYTSFPPSLLYVLFEQEGFGQCDSLRIVITGGETVPAVLPGQFYERLPGAGLLNRYGPTEATISVTSWLCERDGAPHSLPIGRPTAKARVYLVDAALQPVPVGITGEILLGGLCVARGYLGRPDLTAEKFIPDPFSGEAGARLYRTGDLARYRPDGAIEFVGRVDQQVKIRGFRVELGEIEAALARHPALREVAVVDREDGPTRSLAAYLVLQPGAEEPGESELRSFLLESLPAYMVPSDFVVLESLPLSPTGKVDRSALPAPERRGAAGGFVPPRTQTEELLAGIWAGLLSSARIGVDDSFFDLGGHSLLATQVMARVREAFGVDLPLRVLFEQPTVAALAGEIDAAVRAGAGVAAPPLVPVPRDGNLPLSFAQQRLWFLEQLQPGTATYNMPAALRFRGALDATALGRSLREVVRRHETLRTTFAVRGGSPVQSIAAEMSLDLPLIDLRGLPEEHREAAVRRLAGEEGRRPFDLATGPLIRAALLRAEEDEYIALLTLHHIVADGWSIEVLIREIGALYPAFLAGEAPALPELPVQYADFAVWQRQWLQGEVLEAQLAWWRQVLAGHSVLQLATDRPRPAVQKFRGADEPLTLPAAVSQAFLDLGRQQGATPYMALLAGFQALLHRYSGQEDVITGATVAGRDRRELEPLIGFFVNTLPMRTGLAGRPTFQELLARVRETALGALSHQDLPFEKLVEELQPERDLSRSPLFQMVFQLQQAVSSTLDLPGLVLSPLVGEAGSQTAKFDVVLNLRQGVQGLAGVWKYNTDLFDRATLARLSRHFENLLAGAAADPARPVAELPLLTEAERQQLGLEWNAAPEESLACPGLHEIFAARAASDPEAVAVTCDGERLSYGDLDRRANQLANHLIRLGVTPGDLVGLCLERSAGMVVALLGVLKAGSAYVPLDPAYPRERLAFMLEDSRVPVLLAHRSLTETLPEPGPATQVVFLDEEPFAGESGVDPEVPVSAGHPAYVIYTSGSTGRPKGVVVRHGNAVRLFSATEPWFGFGPEDVWTLFHSYAFDFSVWEIWGALLYGGRLVVVPWSVSRSPEAFYELLRAERVTVLNQTPSAFRQLIWAEEAALAGDLALRFVIFGGEALEPASLAPWFARHGDQHPRLINMYGITETTVHVTYRPIERQDVSSVIGQAIPDLGLYVLDGSCQPQPVGVPGEIHVGGAGLALGYLGRPELTAERFVPNPWGGPGARLYRSGDLARRLPDGDLEYLGRIDHQVKIRGFRIELGEIESALAALPGVREAVVLARSDGSVRSDRSGGSPGERRLVAYVVPEGTAPSLTALRTALAGSLPEYMLPSALVVLDRLPLTANGKVDRRSLPAPEASRSGLESSYVAPATALETFLAGLWQEVLGVPRVGVHDDFFELGGSSITGAVLVNRLQEELREIVHVVVIFDAPTVAELAAYLIAQHPKAMARLFGPEALGESGLALEAAAVVGEAEVNVFRSLVRPLAPLARSLRKNPSAVFVLSPPRSGSTLMRVMLGGHPRLFSPPELELLSFNTLQERRAAFSGRDAFWLEGVVRAVMEVRQHSAEEAEALIAGAEEQDLTTLELYGRLQEWLGGRILVDKTPSYALDPAMLQRAEEGFEEPHYIHLIRHPLGMIHSFEEAKLDQIFFRHEHPFSRRQLAELIWRVSHENIVKFLAGVPASRQHWVRFEDLLSEPEQALRELCDSLGIDYHPDMAEPYKEKSARMTDGPHAESRMLGDVKFHQYKGVDRGVAERWREDYQEDFLGEGTWQLAARLGYENERGRVGAGLAPIEPGGWREGEPLPLSFAQERLWFFDQMEPGSPVYHIPAVFRLAGRLDAAALGASLREVVRRHAALRTSFSLAGGEPVQTVSPGAEIRLSIVDLAALPEREEEALRLAYALVRQPFDLSQGPLLRAALLRLGAEEHAVVFTLHHIVSDGWSMGVLMREVAALYRASVAGEPSPLLRLPIQYPDYALWQRRSLPGEALERQIAFWKGNLAGAATLQLPTDRPRPRVQTYRGGTEAFRLPAELSGPLARLGRDQGATPFMTLLAGYAALLARYSGQADVSVGSPVANRNRAETEPLIGLFINMVVLRNDLSGDPGFRGLLARVRSSTLAAFRHQDMPFARVVEEVQPERDLSRSPLFQVMLVQQNGPGEETLALPGLTLEAQPGLEGSTSKVDLTLSFAETPLGLAGPLYYNRDLFDAATVTRFAGHLRTLLAAAVAFPELPLSELPLLTPGEERQIVDWNDTAVSYPTDVCLHELIEEQLASDPGRVAVVFEGAGLTGRELNAAANRLAHRLIGMGVGPEVPVGVFAERSLEMVVALLAILKAGGAYLPLDPEYPEDRILYMLESSRVPVLLTQSHLEQRLPETGARVVLLNAEEVGMEEANPPSGATGVRPGNLAYVIYTSGSTGRPKGVMNTHRGIVNRLLWMQQEYGLTPEDRVLQKTPFSFDVSVWEFFWPLMTGARLVMARPGGHQDAAWLVRTIQAEGITTLHFVPSMLQVFLEAPGVEACVSLIRVIASGEALPYELQRRFFRRLSPGGAELHNLYGPTEAAVDVTYWACEAEGKRSVVPIGRPVANTRIHLLDTRLRPVPVGVPGELHIGGVQVARGYLGRPELTAERFIPDPFSPEPGARLYKTGDLARYLPDGAVDFLGRIDHQVKLRGLRIELEEIEAALAAHPGVREAVVLVRAEGSGALGAVNLVAYMTRAITRSGAEEPTPAALRALLARSLPDYMIPAAWVVLDELPLSPNGKVDRKALARIAPERTAGGPAEKVAPRTDMERALAALWSEVLALPAEDFGIHDNFFELGGNSITGAILINRLQQTLGEIVHVVAVFDAPTVASLAASLAKDYPEAVAQIWGPESLGEAGTGTAAQASRPLDEERLAEVRSLIRTLAPVRSLAPKNPPALFVLSPPRSGSTLLRVMLGGHPSLFAPPELELLNFNTLTDRRDAFSGRDTFRLEGLLRAVMEIRGQGPDDARTLVEGFEQEGMTTQELYRRLQDWIGPRLLVDKTPTYAWDPATLRRAEEAFEGALYLHLVRHPYGMIRSFEEARIDQIFFHEDHPFSRRELAEALWVTAHRNVLDFLAGVPEERQHTVRFEDLLRDPEDVLLRICAFLGLEYHPDMAEPYKKKSERMTDGLHAESRMLGDVKFHEHKGVEQRVAESWRRHYTRDFLGGATWRLAARLGYDVEKERVGPAALPPALVKLRPGPSQRALFLVHPLSGELLLYRHLIQRLGPDQAVYGFQARGFREGEPPLERIEEMADLYVESLLAFQPEGSYLLAGSSMGGVIAFEMARRLQGLGQEVALTALLDAPVPGRAAKDGPGEAEMDLLRYATGGRTARTLDDLLRLTPDQRLELILAEGREAGGLPAGMELPELRRFVGILEANRRALRAYRPEPAGVRATYVRAAEGVRADAAWQPLALGGLEVYEVSGGHLAMHFPPHVQALAARLAASIERAAGEAAEEGVSPVEAPAP